METIGNFAGKLNTAPNKPSAHASIAETIMKLLDAAIYLNSFSIGEFKGNANNIRTNANVNRHKLIMPDALFTPIKDNNSLPVINPAPITPPIIKNDEDIIFKGLIPY